MSAWALDSGVMLYVVIQVKGEYSDRSEHALIVYDNEGAANYHVQQAMARVLQLQREHPDKYANKLYGTKPMGVWDPDFEYTYDWPRYFVASVPKACLMMDELMKLEALSS